MVQEKTPHSPRSHIILRCDPMQGAHKRENTTKNTTARGTQKRQRAVVCPVMQGAHTAQYGHDQVMPCPAHHTLLLKSPATILPVCRASHLLSILCISVMSAPLLPLVFGHPNAGACRAPHPPFPVPRSLLLLVLLFCILCDPQERGTKKRQHYRFWRVRVCFLCVSVCVCLCV